ncbi:MAG: hypothetical protein JW702_00715 [Clostridiales bacterium]|nr:hypothetical protein [Clostridiales bacterium]
MNRLESILCSFKNRKIKDIAIKVNNETISVNFPENDKIEFTGVKSFLFVEDNNSVNINKRLSSIEFFESGFAEFVSYDEDEMEEIYAAPNFALDFMDRSLLIEAEAIHIGGKKISLNKVEN